MDVNARVDYFRSEISGGPFSFDSVGDRRCMSCKRKYDRERQHRLVIAAKHDRDNAAGVSHA